MRHLGGIWEASGGHSHAGVKCANTCVCVCVSVENRATNILHERGEDDHHDLGSLHTKVGRRRQQIMQPRDQQYCSHTAKAHSRNCLGNKWFGPYISVRTGIRAWSPVIHSDCQDVLEFWQ